jgi:hypothetical protein
VAVAGKTDPDLFAQKCAGIYLNAGTGLPDKNSSGKLEYNVLLDKVAYAVIFDLPCPIYWLPCFEGTESDGGPSFEHASTAFRQGEISQSLPAAQTALHVRHTTTAWLKQLAGAPAYPAHRAGAG